MTRQTSKQGELAAAAAPNNNTSQCSKVPTAAMLELTGAGDWLTLDSWQLLPRQVKGQCHNKADGNSFHHHAMQLPCAAQTCGPTSSLLAAMPAQLGLQQTGTHTGPCKLHTLQDTPTARHTYSKTPAAKCRACCERMRLCSAQHANVARTALATPCISCSTILLGGPPVNTFDHSSGTPCATAAHRLVL
jgi:hypothetical protein